MNEYYPRKDELNRFPLLIKMTGLSLVLIFALLLFININSFESLIMISYIIFIIIGIFVFTWGTIIGGKACLRFTTEGIELIKAQHKKTIQWNEIKRIKKSRLDLGKRRGLKQYYTEIEISLNTKLFKTSEIWIYWNMLSFVLPSEIGLDERHWRKENLDSITSFIESKM